MTMRGVPAFAPDVVSAATANPSPSNMHSVPVWRPADVTLPPPVRTG